MTRTSDQIKVALEAASALDEIEPGISWSDMLFAAGDFIDTSRPDQALLASIVEEYPELERHISRLPERMRVDWLRRILGIGGLPVVPDRVIAVATVDTKQVPVVIPAGREVRGGKDAFGVERRYRTLDALTAHGVPVRDARSYVYAPGIDAVERLSSWPFVPFPGTVDAVHACRFSSDVLAFSGGTMKVKLTFSGGDPRTLTGAQWYHSIAVGEAPASVDGPATSSTITIDLSGECAPGPNDESPWLEMRLHGPGVPFGFSFTDVKVEVVRRESVTPDSAYYNDGLLDVTKEFQPFGPAARRGDAFYIRCDEAFSKPIASLDVNLELLDAGGNPLDVAWGWGLPPYLSGQYDTHIGYIQTLLGGSVETDASLGSALAFLHVLGTTSSAPRVEWQHRSGGQWEQFGDSADRLASLTGAAPAGDPSSDASEVGGEIGHLIRAFLADGDFGWTDYQQRVAQFAADAAAGSDPSADLLIPPAPPIVSRITIDYTTPKVAPVDVVATNGFERRTRTGGGSFSPFRVPVPVGPEGAGGMVAIGLDLTDDSLGSSVSLYIDVDSAASCGDAGSPDAAWEYWDGGAWSPVATVDGTRMLRESGLVRLVAPFDWANGSDGVGESNGRWLRLRTAAPARLGTIRGITPDAVVAEYRSQAPDPASDPTPSTPLTAGEIKGLVVPIPGVKKVTNLSGVKGRGPEGAAEYLRRASGVVRHRGRAVNAWDYEELVMVAFPEIAAVKCLPHTGSDGSRLPGSVGLVVIPDRRDDPMPLPSVSLTGRIHDELRPRLPLHAIPAVLCPLYAPVTVEATIRLRSGIAGLVGKQTVESALATWLHPTGTLPVRFGRSLYESSVVAFLEKLAVVDFVSNLALRDSAGNPVSRVDVDPCRGLYASSGAHRITAEEQL